MKYMDTQVFLSHIVNSGVRSHWNVKGLSSCEIFLCDHDGAHNTLWKACMVFSSLFLDDLSCYFT